MLFPFIDRPDIGFPVLFQAVPNDRPWVPPTRFGPRWYDAIDGWVRLPGTTGSGNPDIGRPKRTDWREWQVAKGSYFVPSLLPLEGTDAMWANGVLYSDFLAGRWGPMTQCQQARLDGTFRDLEFIGVKMGRSEAGDAVFRDSDSLDADVATGGIAAAAFSDLDGLAESVVTGGEVSVSLADLDSLTDTVLTGGDAPAAFADLDSLGEAVQTGGDAGVALSDLDSLDADGSVSTSGQTFAGCSSVPLTLYIHFSNTTMCSTYAGGVVTVTSAGGGGVEYSGSSVIAGHTIHGKIREHSGGGVEIAVWETTEPLIYQTATVTCSPFTTQIVAVTPDFCMLGMNIQGLET